MNNFIYCDKQRRISETFSSAPATTVNTFRIINKKRKHFICAGNFSTTFLYYNFFFSFKTGKRKKTNIVSICNGIQFTHHWQHNHDDQLTIIFFFSICHFEMFFIAFFFSFIYSKQNEIKLRFSPQSERIAANHIYFVGFPHYKAIAYQMVNSTSRSDKKSNQTDQKWLEIFLFYSHIWRNANANGECAISWLWIENIPSHHVGQCKW